MPTEIGLKRRMHFNLPNLLTWLRIIAIPLFVDVFYLPDHVGAIRPRACCSSLAGVTDWLDGYLARRSARRRFGAFLDPGRRQADGRGRARAARAGAMRPTSRLTSTSTWGSGATRPWCLRSSRR